MPRTSLSFPLVLFLPLALALSLPFSIAAQDRDATVRPLGAAPVSHHGTAGSATVVLHASGDLVIAAEGVLVAAPDGTTRWHAPEEAIADVASAPDGTVFGMARLPFERPTSVRVDAFAADGTPQWSRTLHRGRMDRYTFPDMTAAPDGDVLVCSTVRRSGRTPVVIDRLGPGGVVQWSREIVPHGECNVVATDASGDIYWAGHETAGGVTRAVLERLDADGNAVWRSTWDGNVLPNGIAISRDALTVAGSFIGEQDLLPGAPIHRAQGDGYTSFATRFDARTGASSWAWVGSNYAFSSIAAHGDEVMVLEEGEASRLDGAGRELLHVTYGRVRTTEGLMSASSVSAAGAVFDARGEVLFVGGLPTPEWYGYGEYFLWTDRPYSGPAGAVIGRPGW